MCQSTYTPTYREQRTCGRTCGVTLRRTEGKYRQKRPAKCNIWITDCVQCGSLFTSRRKGQTICSTECKRARASRQSSAAITKRYHSDPGFRDKVIATSNARRADKLGLGDQHITIEYLGSRDHWTCGICHHRIDHRNQASIDHIVPLSRGGTHTLDNVHVAHRRCNHSKGNRGSGEQLLLVG